MECEIKNLKLITILIGSSLSVILAVSLSFAAPPGTSNARPNLSGGFDYHNASGTKTGSSSLRADGGYDYYDQYGNPIGRLEKDKTSGSFKYHDLNNLTSGSLDEDAYGGFTFTDKDTSAITAKQSQIRRDYEYSNPYGDSIDTYSPDTLRGLTSLSSAASGIETLAPDDSGIETLTPDDSGLGLS